MAKLLKLRRGSTSQHSSFTGAEGEVTVDTDKDVLVVNDGSTAGGHPLAAEDMSNVSSASIAGRLATDSIATSKIAAGALPTDVTVASANIVNGTIVNEDVNASAAIAGTKISPDFGSQNIATTGTLGSGNVTISNTQPTITFTDSDHNPDYKIQNADGGLIFNDTTNQANRLVINTDGHVDVTGNLDVGAGVDVTGNITVTGTVDGVDIAAAKTTLDSICTSNGNILDGTVATTQAAGNNTDRIATTSFVGTAISNLVDSSPAALNTLNELAAAINDDASFSTTITNSIATKMPTAGGTFVGDVSFSDGSQLDIQTSSTSDYVLRLTDSAVASYDWTFPNTTTIQLSTNTSSNKTLNVTNAGSGTFGITAEGTITAATFSGSGASLTNIPAANITGTLPAIDGSNLTGIVSIPAGMIMIWSGAANAIPSGFTLCDGNNSTPDLRDRFVVGAQNSYNVGNTGGATSGSDTVNISFSISGTTGGPSTTGAAGGFQTSIGARENHTHSFSGSGSDSDTVTIATLPPYYALCYVMKT
tara:strand:+ start:2913 stop:4514 length:1602 start_codon:yes stop_codon:yes gene_type:complete